MEKSKLDKKLILHSKWLRNLKTGKHADLRYADLRHANLREADLKNADLRYADLNGADLNGADLSGANIDYSCWPLWCGSQDVTVDERILYQLVTHICAVNVPDSEDFIKIKDFLKPYAEKSHVYQYLKGSIEKEQDDDGKE